MKRKVICLTPVKNEAWIIRRFLDAASLWADYILLADQASTDGTREIALRYEKVILIDNPETSFDAGARRKRLVDEARKICRDAVLIGLDADEMLSADVLNSPEWSTILCSEPGTQIFFDWVNLTSDLMHCWQEHANHFGYVDDGAEYKATRLHEQRVPVGGKARLRCRDIKVLHYNYTAEERMTAKMDYYQLLERIAEPEGSGVVKFRRYFYRFQAAKNLVPVESGWFAAYRERGVDMTSLNMDSAPHHLKLKAAELLAEHGLSTFSKDYIWMNDWARALKEAGSTLEFRDPRNWFQRKVHAYLWRTKSSSGAVVCRLDALLVWLGF